VIVDYHMHLRNEQEEIDHSVEAVERFVEYAIARGIDEIGFTEHVYYFRQTEGIWDVSYQVDRCVYDLDRYVDAVLEAQRRGMPVKLGLEVDWKPEKVEELREALEPYPWDYLLGSIHFIDGLGIDGEPKLTDVLGVEAAWERYFDELGRAAESGLYDSLAHPDLVKIFGSRAADATALHAVLVSRLDGVCLEVSSAGLHKPVGELYPDPALLAIAKQAGVSITLASDAHSPQSVGRDLDSAIEHARAAGYQTVTVFDGRKGRQEPLG
jgi:histidinol-phosphatase (PHP family)